MTRERIIGSYLLRFTEEASEKHFYLHNLKTGEVIQFETWVSVWAFLEQTLEGQGPPHYVCSKPLD